MGNLDIKIYAEHIVRSFSFDYPTFNDSKKIIKIGDYIYVYDAYTLITYEHTLPNVLLKELNENIKKLFNNLKVSSEIVKERNERKVLLEYVKLFPEFYDWKVLKRERPDFVLEKDGRQIGVEITELVDGFDKIVHKAVAQNFGKGLNAKGLEEQVRSRFGSITNEMVFYDGAIGTKTFDIDARKKDFVKLVKKKFEKYENEVIKYERFLLICLSEGIEITSKYDVEDVLNMIDIKPKNSIEVVIIYEDNDAKKIKYSSKIF